MAILVKEIKPSKLKVDAMRLELLNCRLLHYQYNILLVHHLYQLLGALH